MFGRSAALESENRRLRSRVSQLEKELKQIERKYEEQLDQIFDNRDDARAFEKYYTIVLDRLSCALSSAILTALGFDKKDKDYINLLRSVDEEVLKDPSDCRDDDKVLRKANEIRTEALDAYGLYDFARIFMPLAKEGSIAVERMERSDRASYYKDLDRTIGLDDRLKQEKRGLVWFHHSLEEADGSKVCIGPVYDNRGNEVDYTGKLASRKLEEMENELERMQTEIDVRKTTAPKLG